MTRRLLVLTAMLIIPVIAFAQAQTTGRVTGSVVDSDGNPISGARLTLNSSALQGERRMTTGPDGRFTAALLPIGPYSISVTAPGKNSAEISFRLGVGETVPLDITLESGSAIQESVTVYGTATAMQTTASGQNLTATEIDELPIAARDLGTIATYAPNISFGPTGPGGGASTSIAISGAPSYDTVVLLDGAEISDPYFGGGTVVYLEDAIAETQVLTAGISARYGRFQGGVINAVTKSGGNEFDASVRYTFWQQDWDSQTPHGEPQTDTRNETYQGTLGGFILKDKIWFFGGYREIPGTSTSTQTQITQDPYTTASNEDRWQLKLKGAATPNHVIEVSHLEFDATTTGYAGLPAGDARAATGVRADPRESSTATYQAVLTPNLFVDLQATEKNVSIVAGASDPSLGSPIMDWTAPSFFVFKNHWWGGTADPDARDNETLSANANWIKSASHGTHSVEFGVQSVKSVTGGKNSQSGTGLNLLAMASGPPGEVFVNDCVAGGLPTGLPCTFNIDPAFLIERWNAPAVGIPAGGFEAEVSNLAIYAQDTLTTGKWRFDLGLRWEQYDGKGPFISETVSFDQIAPRVGVTYNIDDNWQVQGAWAQYTSRINDNYSNSVTFVGENPSQTELYTGPDLGNLTYDEVELLLNDDPIFCGGEPNGSCFNMILDRTDPNLPTTFLDANLEAPYANDLNLAVKRRLPRNSGTIVVNYTKRGFNNLMEDFRGEACNFTNDPNCVNEVVIPDPGGDPTMDTTIDATLWGNSSQAVRDYESLSLVIDFRPSAKWNVGGNVTLSDTTGNYEGEGQNTPGSGSIIGNFVNSRPEAAAAPIGYLDEHIGTRMRLWGNYRFDFGRSGALSLGSVATYQDGRVWSRAGAVDFSDNPAYNSDIGTYTYFVDGRGQNNFDSWWAVDLSANYNIQVWKKLDTFFIVQILNVLDNDSLVAFQTNGTAEETSPGSGVYEFVEGANFGNSRSAADYQPPRRFRFSVGLRW